jgi:hypothetical protein
MFHQRNAVLCQIESIPVDITKNICLYNLFLSITRIIIKVRLFIMECHMFYVNITQ